MTTAQLKAAVIGLGVGERHVAGYEADPRCKVVALCDIDEVKLAEVGQRHPEKRLTSDPEEILADPAIDVVSIASYDDAHYGQAIRAIRSGKHVFVEKPLCLRDEELDDISQALSERPQIRMSSNLVLRRAPAFKELKSRVESGALGRLYHLDGDYNYGRVHKITEQWRGRLPFYSVTHGGAIHIIDLMLWLTGRRVVEVMALGNQIVTAGSQFRFPDMVTALMRFEDDTSAKVAANFGCVCPHHHMMSVYGTAGTFVYRHHESVFYTSRDPQVSAESLRLEYPKHLKVDVQRAFVAHILDDVPAEVSAAEVMDAMAVSLAIERSLQSRKWERVRYSAARPRAVSID
jgi:predicted dehydrogenase